MSNPGTPEGFGIHVDAPAFAPSSSCRLARTKTILFVCTGNICRSPMAEGLFRHAVKGKGDYRVLSAGVGAVVLVARRWADWPAWVTLGASWGATIAAYELIASPFQVTVRFRRSISSPPTCNRTGSNVPVARRTSA